MTNLFIWNKRRFPVTTVRLAYAKVNLTMKIKDYSYFENLSNISRLCKFAILDYLFLTLAQFIYLAQFMK